VVLEGVIREVPEAIREVAVIKVGEDIRVVVVTKQLLFNLEEGMDMVVVVDLA
jgi:hypothetical protein